MVVFLVARRISHGRAARWGGELFAVIAGALVLGIVSTALDFGGWNEPDWRGGVFVFFGSAAVVGGVRLLGLQRIKGNVAFLRRTPE